jgi:hypothetical protein
MIRKRRIGDPVANLAKDAYFMFRIQVQLKFTRNLEMGRIKGADLNSCAV